MTLELINPEGLSSPLSYTHVVAATGSRLVFVAGQVSDGADGNLVGDDDLAAQALKGSETLASRIVTSIP